MDGCGVVVVAAAATVMAFGGGWEGKDEAETEAAVATVAEAGGGALKPTGGEGKVGEVGVVGDMVADFVFFSFTAGGTFS